MALYSLSSENHKGELSTLCLFHIHNPRGTDENRLFHYLVSYSSSSRLFKLIIRVDKSAHDLYLLEINCVLSFSTEHS